MVCNVFLLHAQTKLDSLDSLIKLNETLVIDTVIRLDSLQNLIEDLQESYAREQFLLLEEVYKTVEKLQLTQEQNMTNKVNIEFTQKQLEKALNDIEDLKDKVRANGKTAH